MHTLPLHSVDASLERVGGKGRSLSTLARAGLPVPDGFLITTQAYRQFIEDNRLRATLRELVATMLPGDVGSVEAAASTIREQMLAASVPQGVEKAISEAYESLGGNIAVAVRSSATAEDLPELSFAGQQDTYLNVSGRLEVIDAVRRCWSSLWTDRAISYRLQMGIDQERIAMGVVVQAMIDAEVSGILFTANPSTGDRDELLINASYGLGEAIVGGEVTPDTFVLDRGDLSARESRLGSKETMIVPGNEQGTITSSVDADRRTEPSMTPDALSELARLSIEAETCFDAIPQDIEWAWSDAKCWLLQSRPITHLPPAPLKNVSWEPPTKGTKLIRRQVVENMPEPLSPLFEDLYLNEGLEKSIDHMMDFFDMSFDIDIMIKRPMFLTVNGYAYCRASYKFSWKLIRTMPRILYWYIISLRSNLLRAGEVWGSKSLPEYQATIAEWDTVDPSSSPDEKLIEGVHALAVADAVYWFNLSMLLGVAKVSDGLLNRYLRCWFIPGDLTSGTFLRGYPSSTLAGQVHLEAIANRIRSSSELRDLAARTAPAELPGVLSKHPQGEAIARDFDEYLRQYGHQIYTLDFVHPTQREEPTALLSNLKSMVAHGTSGTEERQARMARQRDELAESTAKSLGPVRRWVFRKLLGWAQKYAPDREEGLFFMGAAWPNLRRLALELGRRLTEVGTLADPNDVFYLTRDELAEALAARATQQPLSEFIDIVRTRQDLREARKRLHPPGMIPIKSKFRLGPFDLSVFETQKRNSPDSDVLRGFPVSPGTATGNATVISSPEQFHEMQADTILVCPTTTPAWTPLFAHATGLVTDIGGILAHGSIVAREYGIPAVLGTGNATKRIETGQKITVDGDEGKVVIS